MSVEEGDALIEQLDALFEQIRAFPFPALVEEEVTDDRETFMALRCPRCGGLATDDNLHAVDYALRWSGSDECDSDSAFNYRTVTFSGDGGSGDFSETVYYLHNEDHAVSLPDGWTEAWT